MRFQKLAAAAAVSVVSFAIGSCSISENEDRDQKSPEESQSEDVPNSFNTEVVGTWEDICEVALISEFTDSFSPEDLSSREEPDLDDDEGHCYVRIPDAFSVTVWLYGSDDSNDAIDQYEHASSYHENRALTRHEDAFSEVLDTEWDESAINVQPDAYSEEGVWFVARYDSLNVLVSIAYISTDGKCQTGEIGEEGECIPNAPDVANWVEDHYADLLLENIIDRLEEK